LSFKSAVKIRHILKTILQCDLHDGMVCFLHIQSRSGQTVRHKILNAGAADSQFEDVHKMYLRETTQICQLFDGDRLSIMLLHIGQCNLQLVFIQAKSPSRRFYDLPG